LTLRTHHPLFRTGAALSLFALACAQGEVERDAAPSPYVDPANGPGGSNTPGEAPDGSDMDTSSLDLSAWFPAESELVGVAVGERGERYVLDQKAGLYRLGLDGASELVLDATDLERRFGLSSNLLLTDVVSYGQDRFLITAENDGFLLDLYAGTFSSYFCYLPPSGPEPTREPAISVSQELGRQGIPVAQRTNSVAFNRSTGDIFAQPQTVRLDRTSDSIAASEVFVFGSTGGQPLVVLPIADLGFSAGGMVADGVRLLFGSGNALYELSGDAITLAYELDQDVTVSGLALDRDGSLLVLDGPRRRLLDYPIELEPRL
jgi:hypothetical protein